MTIGISIAYRKRECLSLALRPRYRSVVWVLALMLMATPAGSAEWPQWRGPDGLGVSPNAQPLPKTWSVDSPNIRWRTEIPGAGNSSPSVTDGRVFVTTAYEGRQGGLMDALLLTAAVGLTLAFFLLLARGSILKTLTRRPWRLGALILVGASLLFVVIAVIIAAKPDLFLPIGKPGRVWRVGGALALLGLAAASGWFRKDSIWRLVGAAVLLLGAGLHVYLTPSGYKGPLPISERFAYVVPAVAAACWFIVGFVRSRRRVESSPAIEKISSPLLATPLILLAFLVFIPPNFLSGLQRVVVCLDLETGELLWERSAFSAPPEQKWARGTYANPTPASDDKQVFAYFGSGLASFDFDGQLLWTEMFPKYSQFTRYGAAISPILTEETVLMVRESEMFQGGPPSWIAAFDKGSGEPHWRITPEGAHDSYNTPLILRSGATSQLLTATWHALVAYDVDSGKRLWSLDHPMEQVVASMARSDDLLAVSGGAHGDPLLMVMRLGDHGADILWQTKSSVARVSSPVLYDGNLYTVTELGIMICYDAESGTVLWRQRLDGQYFSSLVAGDGKIYASNIEGSTAVVAAASEFELLAMNELDGPIYASPAISDGSLLIRTDRYVYRIDRKNT